MTRSVTVRAMAFLSVVLTTTQCVDSTAPQPVGNSIGVILSGLNPRPAATATVAESRGAAAEGVAYVSLAPGAVPAGITATITNRATGFVVGTPIVQGGFDPVSIGANVGDTLAVNIKTSDSAAHALLVVSARRPPRIVRTNPPPGGRDVPLNSTMVVVFSEPIDPATLTPGVGLRVGDTVSVSGGVAFADPQQVSVAFQPGAQLAPLTTYQLVVTQAIRDLNGIALDSAAVVTFTTGTAIAPPTSPIIAFQSNRGIEEIGVDGLGRAVLIADSTAAEPAWSPDGTRLAFRRVADSGSTCEIYTARADGSDERKITTPLTQPWCAYSPAWSPDGTKIAFTAGGAECLDGMYCESGSIYVVNADGSNETQLLTRRSLPPLTQYQGFRWMGLSFPKWSPDGRTIAFTCDATNGGDDLWWVCIGAADGSGATRLPELVAESPSWSPDGSEIASSSSVTNTSIILRTADGSGVARTLTTPGPCPPCSPKDFDPVWSPDGTQLVFTRATGDRLFTPFISDLFIINQDGTGLRRLTTTGDASRPTWRVDKP